MHSPEVERMFMYKALMEASQALLKQAQQMLGEHPSGVLSRDDGETLTVVRADCRLTAAEQQQLFLRIEATSPNAARLLLAPSITADKATMLRESTIVGFRGAAALIDEALAAKRAAAQSSQTLQLKVDPGRIERARAEVERAVDEALRLSVTQNTRNLVTA